MSRTRRLVVNGEVSELTAVTLAALLEELGYGGRKVATALNGEFVPERERAATRLSAGDAVEIVAPRQGG
ncbi:MAG: sulfur carrier protein ThiS [Hyphomicrobiaceae bacterium]